MSFWNISKNGSHLFSFLYLNPKVLVVQEKTGRFQGQGIWKFPTGVVNEVLVLIKAHYMVRFSSLIRLFVFVLSQGEDIHDGSVREVKEETGVRLLHASTFHCPLYSLHETKS